LTTYDQAAIDIVSNRTRTLEVGYEVALPWNPLLLGLPIKRQLAIYQFNNLLVKFETNPILQRRLREVDEEIF
jgi:hypothetical protein